MDAALLQEFVTEAEEHLEEMESFLLRLENEPEQTGYLNDIFRCIHTIKGASEFVGLERISNFSHKLENLLDELREGKTDLTEPIVTFLITGRDRIAQLVRDLSEAGEEQTDIDDLMAQTDQWMAGADGQEPPTPGSDNQDAETPLDTGFLDEAAEPAPDLMSGDPANEPVDAGPPCEPDPSTAPLTGVATMAAGQDEAKSLCLDTDQPYDEEHDSELYQIFLDQLSSKLAAIESKIDASDPESIGDCYARCRPDIVAMRSSANYMGYDALRTFLDEWTESVDASLSALGRGEQPSDGFMQHCIDQLRQRFFPSDPTSAAQDPEDFNTTLGAGADSNLENAADGPAAVPAGTIGDADQQTDSLKEKLARAFDLFPGGDIRPELTSSTDAFERGIFDTPETGMPAAEPDDTRAAPEPAPGPEPSDRVPDAMQADGTDDAATDPSRIEPLRPAGQEKTFRSETAADEPAAEQPQAPDPGLKDPSAAAGKKNMRVDTEKIDALMNQVGELVVGRSWFSQLVIEMRDLHQQLKETNRLEQREMKLVRGLATKVGEATSSLGRVVNDLQDSVMKIRMLPISQLFNRYPRLVRDLILDTEKMVRLEIKGEETELDKMIIEQMSDPLIHIIRNAVDHGLEDAAERKRAGKPEQGLLELNAYHESNHVVIEIVDDGRGIDPEHIRSVALKKKFISEPELNRMSEKELVGLIMRPGFSTAATVSHTSGRGVGMDVVKKNIEKLNGTIEIDSKVGVETRLRIKIPLTLAIISALLVKVGDKSFAIPLSAVEETLRIYKNQIATVEGFEVIHLRNRTLPLLKLLEIFDVPSSGAASEKAYVVIVSAGQRRIGVLVDSLIGQEEVVIKPLADYLQEESTFSGATILGDGKISLIIDVEGLVNLAIRRHTISRSGPLAFGSEPETGDRTAEGCGNGDLVQPGTTETN